MFHGYCPSLKTDIIRNDMFFLQAPLSNMKKKLASAWKQESFEGYKGPFTFINKKGLILVYEIVLTYSRPFLICHFDGCI